MRELLYTVWLVLLIPIPGAASEVAEERNAHDAGQKLEYGQTVAEVPEAIRKDLYEKAVRFVLDVYPNVEREVLRKNYSKCFLHSSWLINQMHSTQGPVRSCTEGPDVEIAFPAGDRIFLHAYNIPPGITPKKLKKPLTQDEAEKLARPILLRLFSGAKGVGDFRLLNSGKPASRDVYYFEWQDARPRAGQALGQSARIEIRLDDGFVHHARLVPGLPTPRVSRGAMETTAKDSLRGFVSEYLTLEKVYHAGKGRLTWYYAVPPVPRGSPTEVCRWDANTGELLYSEVLNKGTHDKPYRNPSFYTAENEEVFRRNIEEAIKARVAELERQKE